MATTGQIEKARDILIDRNLPLLRKHGRTPETLRIGRAIDRLGERLRGVTWDLDDEDIGSEG